MNVWNNASFFAKCIKTQAISACFNPFGPYKILENINHLKQAEIKTFPFAIPYTPLMTDIAATTLSKAYNQGPRAGLSELANRVSKLPVRELLAPVIASTIGVMARPYVGLALSSSDPSSLFYQFNPSGHMIAKLASALALYESVEAVKGDVEIREGSKARLALVALQVMAVIATDAVMMYSTGAVHHSGAELVAGSLIFAAAYPLASLASAGICKATSSLADAASRVNTWATSFFKYVI
jgi:hypothetical protein